MNHTFDGSPCSCGARHVVKSSDRFDHLRRIASPKATKPEAAPKIAKPKPPAAPKQQPTKSKTVKASPVVVKVVRRAFEIARRSGDNCLRAFHLEAAMREEFVATGGRL